MQMPTLDRLLWRVQPVKHIAKREQRHKEMQEREKAFYELLKEEKKKLEKRATK